MVFKVVCVTTVLYIQQDQRATFCVWQQRPAIAETLADGFTLAGDTDNLVDGISPSGIRGGSLFRA